MNCTNIPSKCRIGDICSYVWVCLFISFIGNISQFLYVNVLKKKIFRLEERTPFLEAIAVLPEASIVEEEDEEYI